ncbi:MAG: LytTR family DNA-binding domain-containing protein [Muribaculaceae bacterium]|nr:LytTR family DNA-binding domain-containing protein [Muribaculaceae bacterium]
MKHLYCIAIDDEPLALDVIAKFCQRLGDVSLDVFSDPEAGVKAIRERVPDVVFLDIEMGNASSLTIASQLPSECCFIFTTAYLDYAFDGFNLDAVDYLHKPFSYARFEAALNKARRRVDYKNASLALGSITVKQEYSNVTIPLDDIVYVEAMEGYSKIFRLTDRCVVTRAVLKKLSLMLPPDCFMRIHRSYIISRSKVHSFSRQEVTLTTGITLPIGRQYAATVAAALS